MNLEELQKALARSLTHAQVESRDTDLLRELSSDELKFGRETLFRKRLSQTRSLLPYTTSHLDARYPVLFRRYHELYHHQGHRAPIWDAIDFSKWLMGSEEIEPWIIDLARWESLPKYWIVSPYCFRMIRLRYDVGMPKLRSPENWQPVRRTNIWIAIRWQSWGIVRRLIAL